ncbi:serine hydrolase domain-containing protein [Brevibacillus fulvus]|uniref:CubicO group peptidase (Beta-lactamase class C family) n=1 Tax=Brevibacillus fulvus TaxID=1125967 RepID=A0A938Y5J8_9BACL|nr:serine hydrolase [Brevibacillus fulvus]MBM7591655.1 CubicO group peptidase (beta-lactamase class C family) [Brevibacillus fulvus]
MFTMGATPETVRQKMKASFQAGIAQEIFPGGISSLTIGEGAPIVVACGVTGSEAADGPVAEDVIYDVASLTKVMVTLPLILLSIQEGRLSLNDPAVRYVPELRCAPDEGWKEKITIYHLLTHTSGLPAWRPFFLSANGREAYLRKISAEQLTGPPGKQVVYSDLGFMLLGFIVERVWEQPIDELAKQLIFAPLGMNRTGYRPLAQPFGSTARIAPTERANEFERQMAEQFLQERRQAGGERDTAEALAALAAFPWRQGIIRGTVHDCNAWYGLDGVSGHAGLFSTITDMQRYMTFWSDAGGRFLDPVMRMFAVRCQTGALSPCRAIGWEASPTGGTSEQILAGSSGGDLLSPLAFGHTGFTGTSIWVDPLRHTTLITLTNRVYPTVSQEMGRWRKAHHNQILALVWPTR